MGIFFQLATFFGRHRYDSSIPEIQAIDYAARPDFKQRVLRNFDVAPTIADMIGIDCRWTLREKTQGGCVKSSEVQGGDLKFACVADPADKGPRMNG